MIIGVIPARYGSTRLKGKPLIDIKGKTLIQRVYERVKKCKHLDELIVATDDDRIYNTTKGFGANVVMTSKECKSGTDRVAEVAIKIGRNSDIFINIQGDEPLISPSVIDKLAYSLKEDKKLNMATAACPLVNDSDFNDPNIVKVVLNTKGYALYFSRSPIPFYRAEGFVKPLKHMGIYAYRKSFLLKFLKLKQSPLEKTESLEQLRVIENGYSIKVIISNEDSLGVDTPEDIERVKGLL